MEVNFTKRRAAVMFGLLIVFFFCGGFEAPELSDGSFLNTRRVTKAWLLCVVLFVGGAFSSTLVDHFVGTMDRSNMRGLYIIFGVICMIGSLVYLFSVKSMVQG